MPVNRLWTLLLVQLNREESMGVKNIHVLLIVFSILLSLFFGWWTLNHNYMLSAYCSFAFAVALIVYCISFIKKMRAL